MARVSSEAKVVIDGFPELDKVLDAIPNNLSDKIIAKAAKDSLVPIQTKAKINLIKHAKGTDDGYSKVRHVARNLRITMVGTGRKGQPGAKLHAKGPDVSVKGSRYGQWNIQGYAKLLAYGSYLTPFRKGHGPFYGFGNYMEDAAREKMPVASRLYVTKLKEHTGKTIVRVGKKYGLKYRAA